MISGREADPTRKPWKGLRKVPLNDGHKRVQPTVRKASTLRKNSASMKKFEEQSIPPVCHQTIIYRVPYLPTRTNKNDCQHFRVQQNAPVLSGTNSSKSLLKGGCDPKESAGPWKYTQRPKHHDQGTMCSDSLLENKEYSVAYIGECGGPIEQNPSQVCKNCDCRSPLCRGDSKLLGDNPKVRGSGPLYNMVLKRSRAG